MFIRTWSSLIEGSTRHWVHRKYQLFPKILIRILGVAKIFPLTRWSVLQFLYLEVLFRVFLILFWGHIPLKWSKGSTSLPLQVYFLFFHPRGTILAKGTIPSPLGSSKGIIPSPPGSSCHKFFSSNQGRKIGSVVGYSTWRWCWRWWWWRWGWWCWGGGGVYWLLGNC